MFLIPAAAVGVALAAGLVPTRSMGGSEAVSAMLVAGLAGVVATVGGSLPVAWVIQHDPRRVPIMVMGAVILKVFILLLIVVPVGVMGWVPLRPLLLWVALSYVVALVAETPVLTRLVRRMGAS